MIELPSCADFEDDVYVGSVIEEAIHLDDVGMVQVCLDLKLSNKLVDDFLFDQQLLFDHL